MNTVQKPHPFAFSAEDHEFLRIVMSFTAVSVVFVSSEDFDRLHELLGRVPTYEVDERTCEFDYERPIQMNQRYMDKAFAEAGYENIRFSGRVVLRRRDPL